MAARVDDDSIIPLDNIDRVFCLSDLHTDRIENTMWLEEHLPRSDLSQRDLLVVAGDISHEMGQLGQSLQLLRQYCQVFFVPGNHEAWIGRNHHHRYPSSLEKLNAVREACRKREVHVDALYLAGDHPVWIVPVQSWYDGTLSFDEDLSSGFASWPWVDFVRCKWPTRRFPPMHGVNARIPSGLVEYFHGEINEPLLSLVRERQRATVTEQTSPHRDNTMATPPPPPPPPPQNGNRLAGLITVSHFLPNQQCLPDWKDVNESIFCKTWINHGGGEVSAKFAKVAGSVLLDAQLRSFHIDNRTNKALFARPMHVFGHSHRPKDFEWEGVRYVHNPLGKARERDMHMISPNVTFQLLWNVRGSYQGGEVGGPPITRYWEQYGGGLDALRGRLERRRSPGHRSASR